MNTCTHKHTHTYNISYYINDNNYMHSMIIILDPVYCCTFTYFNYDYN